MKARGFLSAELVQVLVITALLFTVIVPPLSRFASLQISLWHIEQTIERLFELGQAHYAQSVLRSRCLAQHHLDMTAIGESDTQDGVKYDIEYQQSGVPKAPPSGLRISITLLEPSLSPIKNRLHADEYHGEILRFYAPLSFALADWQELNLATGCIP
ncbi:TPA: transporter [Vibrio vulnificus]|nr:transporter [Vibrio vulnificus]